VIDIHLHSAVMMQVYNCCLIVLIKYKFNSICTLCGVFTVLLGCLHLNFVNKFPMYIWFLSSPAGHLINFARSVFHLYLREAAPNVVKNTHFFGDNFISMALIHVTFSQINLSRCSFDWRPFLCGQFRLCLEINQ